MPNHLYKIGDKVRITTVKKHYPFHHGVVTAIKDISGDNVYGVKSSFIENGKVRYAHQFCYEQCLTHFNQTRKLVRPLKVGDSFYVALNIGTINDYNMRSYAGELMPVTDVYAQKKSLPGSFIPIYLSTNGEDVYWKDDYIDIDRTNQLLLSNDLREKVTPNMPAI